MNDKSRYLLTDAQLQRSDVLAQTQRGLFQETVRCVIEGNRARWYFETIRNMETFDRFIHREFITNDVSESKQTNQIWNPMLREDFVSDTCKHGSIIEVCSRFKNVYKSHLIGELVEFMVETLGCHLLSIQIVSTLEESTMTLPILSTRGKHICKVNRQTSEIILPQHLPQNLLWEIFQCIEFLYCVSYHHKGIISIDFPTSVTFERRELEYVQLPQSRQKNYCSPCLSQKLLSVINLLESIGFCFEEA